MPRPVDIQWRTEMGRPVTAGGLTVTPVARILVARLAGAVVVWKRPVAVVIDQDERQWRLPVPDITRLARVALLGVTLLAALVTAIVAARQWKEASA